MVDEQKSGISTLQQKTWTHIGVAYEDGHEAITSCNQSVEQSTTEFGSVLPQRPWESTRSRLAHSRPTTKTIRTKGIRKT